MTTKSTFYNKIIGSCNEGLVDVILTTNENYNFVREQLILAIDSDKTFIDSMCRSYLDHKFVKQNLFNLILIRNENDPNHILGLSSYAIVEEQNIKILKIYTLCSNNKCGGIIMNVLKDIAEYENCDSIKVASISPAIGFYWKMGFRFLIDNKCLIYEDNELARNERLEFQRTDEFELSEEVINQLESHKLADFKDDIYIMTFCLQFEDEYKYDEYY